MTDKLSLSAGLDNFDQCLALAREYQLGLELMAFSIPAVLDGDWRDLSKRYRKALADLPGPLTLHGPFMDLATGSPDERVNDLTYGRYEHAIRIASELGARQVVFHVNYIGLLHNDSYREGWRQRNVDFWGPLSTYAQSYGVIAAIENMWEFEPAIIGDVLRAVDHPYLKACIDVGHAHLFSDDGVSFDDWLDTLGQWVIEVHMNNNDGIMDLHYAFDWEHGALDYEALLPALRRLPKKPLMVLEMDQIADMQSSLRYFELVPPRA